MRRDKFKKDTTAKNYYQDRFYVSPNSPKFQVAGSKFEDDLKALDGVEILKSYIEYDQMVVFVDKNKNVKAIEKLKEFGYEMMCEISGMDFSAEQGGVEVFYQLLSIKHKRRVRVKCFVKNGEFLASVAHLYKSADWAEREMYDMFGIWIENHPNLKRIIMPDDWYGHPLLKSYPLHGDEHAKWYEVDKIFGREYRDIIGPENRDSAFVDSKDTFNFSRIYHETEYGGEEPTEAYLQEYQEESGVPLVKKPTRDKFKTIKKRR